MVEQITPITASAALSEFDALLRQTDPLAASHSPGIAEGRCFGIWRDKKLTTAIFLNPEYEGLAETACYICCHPERDAVFPMAEFRRWLQRIGQEQSHPNGFVLILSNRNEGLISHLSGKDYNLGFTLENYRIDQQFFSPAACSVTRRPFEAAHKYRYLSLWAHGFEALRRRIGLQPFLWASEYPEQALEEITPYIDKGSFHAYWLDDEPVGLAWHDKNYIANIVVTPARQNRGIGGQILGHLLPYIFTETGMDHAVLEVVGDNHAALRFYERYGFQKQSSLSLLWPI
ncbi:acetyltransferase (GNAT) family protein [Aestuariispira insulae]|uniref:Acetyltransferase (GNAT) family protein n=2 Tax=Aestuariispira insulae TaxID=1461337 RepID=A0A3D9HXF6_9PROT|nr:acetyltransferase (GNAT) family protein [Aestuariispira insulae]